MVADFTGALYGTTTAGGASNVGTVFKLTPSSSGYTQSVLYSFHGGADGGRPYARLLLRKNNSLYGTTVYGGTGSTRAGTVFKITRFGGKYTETVIHSFTSSPDGDRPQAGLIADAAGVLYGTTYYGGSYNGGAVFKLTPVGNTYTETIIYSFRGGTDGAYPQAGLVADTTGALYGTTWYGGLPLCGTVFKLTPSKGGYIESIIHTFTCQNDGGSPSGELIVDAKGNLYGTTSGNGLYGAGNVFKLIPMQKGYSESVLHSFLPGSDGTMPVAGLLPDKSGALYGTASLGSGSGAGWGIVFKLTPFEAGYTYSILYNFQNRGDGANPRCTLISDKRGALYGTTSGDLSKDLGNVFKLTP